MDWWVNFITSNYKFAFPQCLLSQSAVILYFRFNYLRYFDDSIKAQKFQGAAYMAKTPCFIEFFAVFRFWLCNKQKERISALYSV